MELSDEVNEASCETEVAALEAEARNDWQSARRLWEKLIAIDPAALSAHQGWIRASHHCNGPTAIVERLKWLLSSELRPLLDSDEAARAVRQSATWAAFRTLYLEDVNDDVFGQLNQLLAEHPGEFGLSYIVARHAVRRGEFRLGYQAAARVLRHACSTSRDTEAFHTGISDGCKLWHFVDRVAVKAVRYDDSCEAAEVLVEFALPRLINSSTESDLSERAKLSAHQEVAQLLKESGYIDRSLELYEYILRRFEAVGQIGVSVLDRLAQAPRRPNVAHGKLQSKARQLRDELRQSLQERPDKMARARLHLNSDEVSAAVDIYKWIVRRGLRHRYVRARMASNADLIGRRAMLGNDPLRLVRLCKFRTLKDPTRIWARFAAALRALCKCRGKNKKEGKGRKDKREVTCHGCKQPGHIRPHCPNKEGQQGGGGKQNDRKEPPKVFMMKAIVIEGEVSSMWWKRKTSARNDVTQQVKAKKERAEQA
ncbi:MAG: hypothetical protein AAF405_08150, partial [Pseudomonadota bacterium]